jgi:spore coat polysaccharide biosynthesis protein SpsF (cytidylyltransferase family)
VKVVTVVQARMGSRRFPGKVLTPLRGRPMLSHVLERALASRCTDAVVLATSDQSVDDHTAELGTAMGVEVVRGPVEDVLTRFVMAQRATEAGVVVRVTADCPLLDPRMIDRVVRRLIRSGVEYVSNVDPATYPDGYDVEAMTAACLARLDAEALELIEREHVTARIRERPNDYVQDRIASRRDYSAIRLTVDVPEDLEIVERLLAGIESPRPGLGAVLEEVRRKLAQDDGGGLPVRDQAYFGQRALEDRP